ncbi:MAG: tandem-95 repeat protein [Planctomycetes bacterium]|nr:tandem-95 repeat protein [Planctomycetota bacterium]
MKILPVQLWMRLHRFWDSLFAGELRLNAGRKAKHGRHFQLGMEALEARELLTSSVFAQQLEPIALIQTESALIQEFDAANPATTDASTTDSFSVPLSFQANSQVDAASQFQVVSDKYQLLLDTSSAATIILPASNGGFDANPEMLQFALFGANDAVIPVSALGSDSLTNSLPGTDSETNDASNAPGGYSQLWYQSVYTGIDESFEATADTVTFHFFIQPLADPNQIVLSYTGAESLQLDTEGNLLIQTPSHYLLQTAPVAFQEIDGGFQLVESSYVLDEYGQLRIHLGDYDPSQVLAIDPIIQPQPPIANNDSYSAPHDRTLSVAAPGVLFNDTYRGGPQFTAVLVSGTSHGSLTLNNDGSFTYNPTYHFVGQDSFTYKAYNGISYSGVATATINVFNNAPAAGNDSYNVTRNHTLSVSAPGVLANDSDPENDSITASLVESPSHGAVTLNANGSFTYTPAANYLGSDSFKYKASDGLLQSNLATVSIQITTNNPVAVNDSGTTNEDTPLTISVLQNDSDADGDSLVVDSFTQPTHGSVLVNANNSMTYTPEANWNGSDSFTYSAADGMGGHSNSATVTITVNPVNDAPSFTKGADQSVLEDSGPQSVSGWATAISAGPSDENSQTLNFIVTNSNNALFSAQPVIDASGTLTYTPAPDADGSATVTVKLHDNGGTANGGVDTSAAQTFIISVAAVNDPPSFTKGADQTALEDAGPQTVSGWATAISAGPSDESGQTLDFIVSNDNNALFAVQPAIDASGKLTYSPAPDANGSATITVKLHDSGGTANGGVDASSEKTFVINVTPVNDAPSFNKGDDQFVSCYAGPQSVSNWATGISAGPSNESSQSLSFIVTTDDDSMFSTLPQVSADGTLTYVPAIDVAGNAIVTVVAHDNGGTANGGMDTSLSQTFIIRTTTDHAPVANDDVLSGHANTPISGCLLTNDFDPDNNPIVMQLIGN